MNIAVLSDIHGYSLAFEAVLADIDQRDIDKIIVAGDLLAGGPDPARVIELLKQREIRCVYGNTDRDVLDAGLGASGLGGWVREQVGPGGLDYLRSLPFSIREPHHTGSGHPATDLLVVHANPTDVDRHLSPNASDREVSELIGDEAANTIAFGHLHVAYVRQVGAKTLVDVSAVGNPRDGDLRPRYVVFNDRGDNGWTHQFHYVDYPLDDTRVQMERSGMPGWRKAFDRLQTAR